MIDGWVMKAWVTDGCTVPVSVMQLSKQDGGVGHSPDETLKKEARSGACIHLLKHG